MVLASDRPKWLVLEPYYGGSHRHLIDELVARLPVDFDLMTLPPRKWKWRMRGAALQFARQMAGWTESPPDGIFATSLLDVAALRGLLPEPLRGCPIVLYCHENQLRYPVQVEDKRDYHYAWTNIQSLLAADRVLWNSAYNRDSFLGALPEFLERLPDHRPRGIAAEIAARSSVLPVPLDLEPLRSVQRQATDRQGLPRFVWNHRWEHDKDPEQFFAALEGLVEQEIDFEVAVLGQAFQRRPDCFDRARASLGERVVAWGFRESRRDYLEALARADFAVSTARHEFQGLAVLEAAACGAIPVVPDALAYPEIWPEEVRYPPGELLAALVDRIRDLETWRERSLVAPVAAFGWRRLLPLWREVFYDSWPTRRPS